MTIDSCYDCESPTKAFDCNKSYLLDGGFASQLEDNGWTSEQDPLWSSKLLVTDPDAVKKVHRQFIEAGADIITTNSYQASIDGFKASLGLNKDDALAAISNSVTLARAARNQVESSKPLSNMTQLPRQILVAGSIGPYGASLCDGSEYTGAYGQSVSKTFLKNWHKPRLMALLAGGVDCLALETFPCLKEALAVTELLQALDTQCPPVWVSFTLKAGDAESKTLISDGKAFEEAYQALSPLEFVVGIGANCVHPDTFTSLLRSCQGETGNCHELSKPLVFYPNSGEVWDHTSSSWYGAKDCLPLATFIPAWHQGGARIVGGCCRVLHTDIAEMRKALDACVDNSKPKNGTNHCD